MTNDEILRLWHKAEVAHADADPKGGPKTLFDKMATEQAAIERFGLGLHVRAYRALFGTDPGR